MKNNVVLFLKNGLEVHVSASIESASAHQVILDSKKDSFPMLIQIHHQGLTTMLDLSNLYECTLLHFDENLNFSSATFCNSETGSAFIVQTQSKSILVLPLPLPFQLEEISSLTINL